MAVPIRSIAIAALTCLSLGAGAAGAATRIILLPISVYATGAEVDYLQSGLMEMLASRLDQYDGLVVVRPGGDVVSARVATRFDRSADQAHVGLGRCASTLFHVAPDTGANHVLPAGFTAPRARNDVVQAQLGRAAPFAAVLA